MAFEDNWWNFHFERSNSVVSKNVSWKALNCESRGEIGHTFVSKSGSGSGTSGIGSGSSEEKTAQYARLRDDIAGGCDL